MMMIETLMLTTLGAVLSGIVVVGIAALLRYDRTSNKHVVQRHQLQYFAARVREDIHQATGLQWDEVAERLELLLPNKSIVSYQWRKGRWLRQSTATSGREIVTPFELSASLRCRCSRKQASTGDLIRLVFTTTKGPDRSEGVIRPAPRVEIAAAIGHDRPRLKD